MTEIRLRAGRPRHRGPGILPGASCSTLQVKTLFQISAALAFEFLNISCSHATPLLSQETTRGSVQYSLHSPEAPARQHLILAHGRVYNPYTGASAAGGRVSTAYGSAGRAAAYNPVTGKAAAGGYVSGERGTVAGGRTNQGSGAVAWDTKAGQGAVVKTKNDNVYAARNGNVYKKDADGNWSSNAGGNWKPVEPARPTPQAQRPSTQPQRPSVQPQSTSRQSLDSMARSRERGSMQTQRAQSFQRSAPSGGARSGGGGGARGGGGGSRRR